MLNERQQKILDLRLLELVNSANLEDLQAIVNVSESSLIAELETHAARYIEYANQKITQRQVAVTIANNSLAEAEQELALLSQE